jgi:N4 Gp49/Sf6 Gp66 family protein
MSEQEIEEDIRTAGLTGPRITPECLDDAIVKSQYYVFPETTITVACLTLENGFCVVGKSACVDPTNFNQELGRKIAYTDARDKIWELEGYLLREILHRAEGGEK